MGCSSRRSAAREDDKSSRRGAGAGCSSERDPSCESRPSGESDMGQKSGFGGKNRPGRILVVEDAQKWLLKHYRWPRRRVVVVGSVKKVLRLRKQ